MPRKPTARDRARLAEAMNDRRLELKLTWRTVAQRAGLTTETVLQVRRGAAGAKGALSQRRVEEDGLRWRPGSIDSILAGGDPTPLPDTEPDRAAEARTATLGVLAAIDADPSLLPEAKVHLRNQYGLLLRINQEARAAVASQLEGQFDEGLERTISAEAQRIRNIPGLTPDQVARLVEDMEDQERERAAAAAVGASLDPRDTVMGDELDVLDLDESDVEAAGDVDLGEQSVKQRRQVDR